MLLAADTVLLAVMVTTSVHTGNLQVILMVLVIARVMTLTLAHPTGHHDRGRHVAGA